MALDERGSPWKRPQAGTALAAALALAWGGAACGGQVTAGGEDEVVPAGEVVEITLSPAEGTLQVGEIKQFSALGSSAEGRVYEVTTSVVWESSDPEVAPQEAGPGKFRGAEPGEVEVSATMNGVTARATLTVVDTGLDALEITPGDARLDAGTTTQLHAMASYDDARVEEVTPACTWTTTNPDAASVDEAGLVTGVGGGSAHVKCEFEGMYGMAEVEVF